MKARSKRLVALFATLAMTVSLLAGCGGGSSEPASSDSSEGAAETEQAAEPEAAEDTDAADTGEEAADTSTASGDVNSTPRNETLYFAGQQWGTINDWNPFSANSNNAMAIQQKDSSRTLIYETLFMFNMLDGQLYPLLATDWAWDDDAMTSMTIHLNPDAHWSDGSALTAEDVAYTWDCNVKYESSLGVDFPNYVESITAVDDTTVELKCALDDAGNPTNPLKVQQLLQQMYIMQKAYLETVETRNDSDKEAMKLDKMDDLVASGPYMPFYDDDQKVVFIRDENYWGQADSMWGKLPAPKYIAHVIYADNNAGQIALKAGEVDVCQQFITDVQKLWEDEGLPITTYIDEPPYGQCATMPSCWMNVDVEGLDQVEVRKAIAMATDYDQIIASAMSNQSPTFKDVPRSTMNPTDGEQALYDQAAVKDLQFAGNDIDGANALLDEAGIVDSDGDGIREYNGKPLSFKAECPDGWTDWMASLEIVASSAKNIGIDIQTYFPDTNTFYNDITTGAFEICMNSPSGSSVTNPWGRCMQFLSSQYADLEVNWSGNWSHYRNDEADEILAKIPLETDEATLKEYYTRLNEIYLTDVPNFALMYRPELFYAVNETVWTGYPMKDDGSNVPPTDCTDGYGIAALYNLTLVE
ncbi:ABC transporter substrate-binding protein [Parablautia intestinalis]|uniref:ABC transporter substrate-binding protein n=1 Tax=Parablautia intestinalis TaxID=2320100 RepID=UPI0023BE486B|nr:ABC transporter substrate-binding protein [Parablautia intestinalis]MDE7046971.1 ABC transporter substrate-binding protein [Lachnospiraceae bacterium]